MPSRRELYKKWRKLRIKYNAILIINDILELVGDILNLLYSFIAPDNRIPLIVQKLWFALDDKIIELNEELSLIEFELFGYANLVVRSEEILDEDIY